VYYIFSEAWAKEIYAGLNFRQANKVLLQLGVLSPGSGGKASKTRNEARLPNVEIPGRVYVVDGLRLADVMGDLDD
jgi:hypothetical protein